MSARPSTLERLTAIDDTRLREVTARTKRWEPEELLYVGQFALCYEITPECFKVRLYGGGVSTVAELRNRGYAVRLPTRVRRGDGA